MYEYSYLFGPLPSRRFGRSLGVDLTPAKTCSLNCRFCQLGETTRHTLERREYVPTASVLEELKRWREAGNTADVITLAGSGEPTLHTGFGDVLRWVRSNGAGRTLLLSNGTLFGDSEVRAAAALADIVKLSLHAATSELYNRIARPHPSFRFDAMIEGYRLFREAFDGQICLEIFVLPGFNDTAEDMARIAALAAGFNPNRIDLNTAVRPTPYGDVRPVSQNELARLAQAFDPPAHVPGAVGIVQKASKTDNPTEQALLDVLRRHPCSIETLSGFLDISASALQERLACLERAGRVRHEVCSDCWTVPEKMTTEAEAQA